MSHDIQILQSIPLNTQAHYVRGITKDGCEIYMPVDTRCPHDASLLQAELRRQLDEQDLGIFTPPTLEPIA